MSVRSIRLGKTYVKNVEQQQLLEAMLDTLDRHMPARTLDALDVLTIMLATLVTTHANSRECSEIIMSRVVQVMDQIIEREPWPEEHPELRRH